jgi:hypothetical protein
VLSSATYDTALRMDGVVKTHWPHRSPLLQLRPRWQSASTGRGPHSEFTESRQYVGFMDS